jgi:integrase
MATITRRKNADGSTSYVAQVRIRPFNPTAKAFSEKKTALAWAEELEETLRKQRTRAAVRPNVGSLTFAQLATEYLADPETTRKKYFDDLHRQLTWWTEHYGNVRALEFSVIVIREARATLRRSHEPATCNRYLSAARSCLNWGRGAGLLPVEAVWPPRCMFTEAKHREKYLTDKELAALLKEARAHSPLMLAAVAVAVGSGCRQGEMLRLRWADVDLDEQQLTFHITNGDEPRRVHLPKASCDALAALKEGKVAPLPSRAVFVNADGEPLENYELLNRWKHVRKAAQLTGLRWHDLRHSTASFLIQNGATLAEVGHALGHRNVATTARYAHLIKGRAVTGADKLNEKLGG